MAITRTTPSSERAISSTTAGVNLNKPLRSSDLRDLEVTNLTVGGEIVLGAGTVGLTLSTTAATPAEVLRFSTLRAGTDGDVQRISFRAWDSNNVLQEYAQINAQLNDVTAATLDSSIELACMVAGTMTTVFDSNVSSAGVITSTFPVGDTIITDGSLAITDADNANSLIVTNNTATTSDVIQFIGSGVFTGTGADAFVNITQSGATTGEAFSVIANGLTSGTAVLLSSTGTLVTTGDVLSIVANTATTSTGLLRASGTALTDGWVSQLTGGGANATVSGGVLDIDAGAAVLGSALRVGTTGVYTGATGVVDINAAAATTGDIVVIGGTGLTEGSALRINTTTATLTTGFYLECNDGAASDFTIADNGATIIAGSAAGTDALTITAGDILVSSGDIDISLGHIFVTENAVGLSALELARTEDAASVQVAMLEGNRATPTDGDTAFVALRLSDSAGNQDEGARIQWQATTVLSGATQDTDLSLHALTNNVLATVLVLDGSAAEVVFSWGARLTGITSPDLGTVTTIDINGGTLDAVTIGATTPAAATVSTLSVTGTDIILDSDIANTGTLRFTTGAAAAVITLPNATGTLYSTVASSISSAQLLSSMSDETGTGLLVFATAPAIVGGSHIELTGLSIRSTGAGFDQLFATATVFTADRTLNFAIGDADRTLTMTGDATLNQDVSTTANPTFGNLTITSFAANWTNAGRTVADAGILTTVDINGGSIDGTAIGAAATSTIVGTTIDATTDFTIGSLVITSNTLTATGRLTTAMTVPTVDTGFNGAQTALWAPLGRAGAAGPVITEFIVDLTNLIGSTTDLDIIGDSAGVVNCNFGQITAAVQGTIVAMEMICLEAPAGGPTDIDVYSAVEATGAEDTAITALTETAIITSGAGWTNGRILGGTALPAANEYMYLVVGVGGVPGTYTAGKFLIRFYGTV